MSKIISIIIPVCNEEDNIPLVWSEINRVFSACDRYDYELIFVDDGSRDNSGLVIRNFASFDERVSLIELSRNFGKEMATSAGLHNATGEAAIILDADLQHPPRLIMEFIEKWESGADMVIGVRRDNKGAGLTKNIGSKIFYWIMDLIGEKNFMTNSTDFRLVDKKIIREFKRFTEHNRLTRGLLDWVGFKKDFIYFSADRRKNGKASYSSVKLVKLAFSTFVNHSLFPLKFAGYLGIMIIMFSGPLGIFIFVDKYIANDPFNLYFSGTAILAVFNLFLIGIVLSCLGLMALYIGNIQNEVVNRPMYIISGQVSGRKNKK